MPEYALHATVNTEDITLIKPFSAVVVAPQMSLISSTDDVIESDQAATTNNNSCLNVTTQPGSSTFDVSSPVVPKKHTRLSVLVCGHSNLKVEGISDKLHVADQLGRRKLRSKDLSIDAYAKATDVFWLAPKKYWTVSKGESCLQDLSLDVLNCFLRHDKDVVIVAPKDYRWRNKNPSKILHRYDTPGHVVLCTQVLDKLSAIVGPSADEQMLNFAIASCLKHNPNSESPSDREGVRQSYTSLTGDNGVPAAEHPKISRRRIRQGSKSPAAKTERKVKFKEDDEYDLGDHATNDDKPSQKPNYAKQHMQEKHNAKKHIEKSNDDCGDDVSAIEINDNAAHAAFLDDVEFTTICHNKC